MTNGLGGYASGTIGGIATRRYHGLLVAALPPPEGRCLVVPQVDECLLLAGGNCLGLGREPGISCGQAAGHLPLEEFRLEQGLPVWRYSGHGLVIERRVLMPHAQNTTHVAYRMLEGTEPVRLTLSAAVHYRAHDAPVDTPLPARSRQSESGGRFEIAFGELPSLKLLTHALDSAFTIEDRMLPENFYAAEASRGYEHRSRLTSPGYFRMLLDVGAPAALIASVEPWETVEALTPAAAAAAEQERRSRRLRSANPRSDVAAELVLAADQFLVRPAGRSTTAARLRAEGEEGHTVIAGYHWFTDWGRDTMISLEGLTLAAGRYRHAESILRTFADAVHGGLIPNLFPEGSNEGLYHTADATLWFFHAIDRYAVRAGGEPLLDSLLPKLVGIAEAHMRGASFGIGVDPADGLLRQGAPGFQLTWMDAKVGDWVVTPRRGKAVEINALWYNALRLLATWLERRGDTAAAARWNREAERTFAAFNERFWNEEAGYLYDVVDGEQGDDGALRPNQIIAISLQHPVLEQARWPAVVGAVRERLLTPFGLRTLAPGHPAYQRSYDGDLRSRDAAYHQGTVWPWLIGPFIDAWLKTHPGDFATARGFLESFEKHLNEGCIGSIGEIFDAEPPYTPRGCIAQAWSVAEVLRCLAKLEAPEWAPG